MQLHREDVWKPAPCFLWTLPHVASPPFADFALRPTVVNFYHHGYTLDLVSPPSKLQNPEVVLGIPPKIPKVSSTVLSAGDTR